MIKNIQIIKETMSVDGKKKDCGCTMRSLGISSFEVEFFYKGELERILICKDSIDQCWEIADFLQLCVPLNGEESFWEGTLFVGQSIDHITEEEFAEIEEHIFSNEAVISTIQELEHWIHG